MEADKQRKTARFGIAEGRAIKETEGTMRTTVTLQVTS
jgi:hypothetical protein